MGPLRCRAPRLAAVTTTSGPLESLCAAIEKGRDRPVPRAAFQAVASRFLAPDERVLLALEANNWTLRDPLVLVTDRRVVHLRRGAILGWRHIREIPAGAITGAQLRPGFLWNPVRISSQGAGTIQVLSGADGPARRFVDGLNALVAGRR